MVGVNQYEHAHQINQVVLVWQEHGEQERKDYTSWR